MARLHVYRGLALPHEEGWHNDPMDFLRRNLNRTQLGIHWTPKVEIAGDFSSGGWARHGGNRSVSTILSGQVDAAEVVQPGSSEWRRYAADHDIMEPDFKDEQEVTVRKGAPVRVQQVGVLHDNEWKLFPGFKGHTDDPRYY